MRGTLCARRQEQKGGEGLPKGERGPQRGKGSSKGKGGFKGGSNADLAQEVQAVRHLSAELGLAAEDVRIVLLEPPHPREPRQRCAPRQHGRQMRRRVRWDMSRGRRDRAASGAKGWVRMGCRRGGHCSAGIVSALLWRRYSACALQCWPRLPVGRHDSALVTCRAGGKNRTIDAGQRLPARNLQQSPVTERDRRSRSIC